MSVAQLQPTSSVQIQTVSKDAEDRDAEFLSFKLLNKRARVRLSPEAVDLNVLTEKGNLIAVANLKGWFAAVTKAPEGEYVIFSPLSDLQAAFSSEAKDYEISFQPQRKFPVQGGNVTMLTFGLADSRFCAGLSNGAVAVFDTGVLFSPGNEVLPPLHLFPPASPGALRQLAPNPGELPALLAIIRGANGPGSTVVEVFDLQKLEAIAGWNCGATPETIPTTLSWSPKGKQLAIGMQNGDLVSFAPSSPSTPKSVTPHPPPMGSHSIISATWLSNPTFHAIYAPQGPLAPDAEQAHFVISLDSKAGTATDVKLTTPYMSFPGLRPPGAFVAVLRKWNPTEFIMVIGDSTSSDIGVIGNMSESTDVWHNFSLEESGTPSLPLDKDMNDTVLLGLELDFTTSQRFKHTGASGEEQDLPPPPIMYAYCSDGTLQAWHVVNAHGEAYPGMAQSVAASAPPLQQTMSSLGAISRMASDSGMAESPAKPGFDQVSGFGFGQVSNGEASVAQTSAFGSQQSPSAFGQSSFGQPSAFGDTSGSASHGNAFSAFASSGPSAFGQANFVAFSAKPADSHVRAGSSDEMAPDPPPAPSEDAMVEETPGGFGGLSLGGSDSDKKASPFGSGASNLFGQAASTPSANLNDEASKPTSAFGSSSFGNGSAFQPAQGFGAFGGLSQSSAFIQAAEGAKPAAGSGQSVFGTSSGQSAFGQVSAASQSVAKPASGFGAFANAEQSQSSAPPATANEIPKQGAAFGKSSFGPSSSFGQPAFGQSAFGQSVFGKPSFSSSTTSAFGQPATGSVPPSSSFSNTGGFASFAGSGTSAFSQAAKPDSSPDSADGGGFSAFAGSGASAFGSATPKEDEASKTRGASVFASSGASALGSTTPKKEETSQVDPEPSTPHPSQKAPPTPAASTSSTPEKPSSSVRTTIPSPPDDSPPTTPVKSAFNAFQATAAFKASSPAATSGAFGNLQASPSAFGRPGEGFGAFGASTTNKGSPFFNAAGQTSATSPNISAFGGTTPTKPSSVSAFGSPSNAPNGTSVFGRSSFGQSSFATPTTTPPGTPAAAKAPTSGGFGAFSSGSSSFSAAAGAPKSAFSDILKSGGDTKRDKADAISSPSGFSAASSNSSAATSDGKGKSAERPETPETGDEETTREGLQKDGSLSSLSSSFTEIERPSDEETEVPGREGAHGSEGSDDGPEGEDDTGSFVSEEFSDEYSEEGEDEEGEDESAEEDEDEDEDEDELEEQAVPSTTPPVSPIRTPSKPKAAEESTTPRSTPPSRATSATPQPGTPDVWVQPATPSKSEKDGEDLKAHPRKSTTPPGSPAEEKPITAPASQPMVVPTPVPFGLGPGKPNTRPSRSSPLANVAASSQDDEDDKEKVVKEAESNKQRPAFSKAPFGSASAGAPVAVKQEEKPVPRIPPLSSLFGNAASKPPTPSLPPPSSSPFGTPPDTASPSALPSSNVFGGKPFTIPSPASTPPATTPSSFGPLPSFSTFKTAPASPASMPPPAPMPSFPSMKRDSSSIPVTPPAAASTTSAFPGFGRPSSAPGTTGASSATPTPMPAGFTPFGKPPPAPSAPSPPLAATTTPTFAFPSPGTPGAGTTPASATAFGGAPFGKASPPAPSPFVPAATPSSQPPLKSAFAGFGGAPPALQPHPATQPTFTLGGAQKPALAPAPQPPPLDAGMQAECSYLVMSLEKELDDLRNHAQLALKRKEEMSRSFAVPRGKADLGDRTKWSMGDIAAWGDTLKQLKTDVISLKGQRDVLVRSVRQLESDMLKAWTKKEEIARFDKASTDAGFAKMLKARTLGPEHLETQTQLRRDTRNIRDRVQKLEGYLASLKKRVASAKSGKSQIKAPSLDTVNRTLRNIDLAIDQESTEVNTLISRISKLNLDQERAPTSSSRHSRLSESPGPLGRQVTPSVAASTASALNAERSAQKLKRALLTARPKPLLNATAAAAPAPPKQFETPGKPEAPAFALSDVESAEGLPEWALPPSTAEFHPSGTPMTSTHGSAARRSTKHLKPVQLKKSQSPAVSTAPAPSFDWGPFPTVHTPARGGLAFDLRASASPSPSK